MSPIGQAYVRPSYVGGNPTATERTVWSFRHYRQKGMMAVNALAKARDTAAQGLKAYPRASGIGAPFRVAGDMCRVVENPADHGLRLVGYADKVSRAVRHTGWFLEDDGVDDSTARGIVYQIPARNGRPCYVAAFHDSMNDGAPIVSFETTDDEITAAVWADSLAESYAETERDYRRANNARFRYESLGDDIACARTACLALIKEARDACASLTGLDRIKAAIRARIESYLEETATARRARADLHAAFANCNGWQDY